MKKSLLQFSIFLLCCLTSWASEKYSVSSPNGSVTLNLLKSDKDNLSYEVIFKNKNVILPSALGFKLSKPKIIANEFSIVKIDSSVIDETWKPVWGEQSLIRNNCKELEATVKTKSTNIIIKIVFRVFNEGVGFRYEFPSQENLNHFIIADELTQFNMTGDHKVFWIPGDYDSNEFAYTTSLLSGIDASGSGKVQEIFAKCPIADNAVQTPLMMKSKEGIYINIHEAALKNYPAMNLLLNKSSFSFSTQLVPDAVGNKAYLQTPSFTPWRTIIFSDKAKIGRAHV